MKPRLVSVAVPTPLRRTFDYFLPNDAADPLAPGTRVRIAFGKRKLIGVATQSPRAPAADDTLDYKSIEEIVDAEPLLPPEVMALCEFTSDYYQHPIGEVLATALPGPLRRGKPAVIKALRAKGTKKKRAKKGDPKQDDVDSVSAAAEEPATPLESPPTLTSAQQEVLRALEAQGGGFSASLLEGVTGSGKTEIYLQRIAEILRCAQDDGGAADDRGADRDGPRAPGQALVLVPEIGLTPQLLDRFQRRLGSAVAAFHSGMTEAQRAQSWLRARAGEVSVIIGTRSAIFLPFKALKLIVVDEEHDTSYKQQDGLRYSARDLAVWRARHGGFPVILGSATPSLESLQQARRGRYHHLHLKQRPGEGMTPPIRLLDVRTRPLAGGLSPPMIEAVRRHVDGGGLVLLFLNRRGYAPALYCDACSWTATCKRCDAHLSLHRYGARLLCHHCGAQGVPPKTCPECSSDQLRALGQGTERVEQSLAEHLPNVRIERMDSDRLRKAGELQRLLGDVRAGDVHVLIGTQVLAKGHDFERLSLVGIVSADQALYGTDFRSLERMGQIVTQVAGRAGRPSTSSGRTAAGAAQTEAGVAQSDSPPARPTAEVILQTREPSHPMLRLLLADGYGGLCDALLEERRGLQMPPFSHLALLRAESVHAEVGLQFLSEAKALFGAAKDLQMGEPVPAPMERRAGRYRAQLLLQSGTRSALHAALSRAIPQIETMKSARKVRWSIDVDPADLF